MIGTSLKKNQAIYLSVNQGNSISTDNEDKKIPASHPFVSCFELKKHVTRGCVMAVKGLGANGNGIIKTMNQIFKNIYAQVSKPCIDVALVCHAMICGYKTQFT